MSAGSLGRWSTARGSRDTIPTGRLYASLLSAAHLNWGDLPDGSNALVSRTARRRQGHHGVPGGRSDLVLLPGSGRHPVRTGS